MLVVKTVAGDNVVVNGRIRDHLDQYSAEWSSYHLERRLYDNLRHRSDLAAEAWGSFEQIHQQRAKKKASRTFAPVWKPKM